MEIALLYNGKELITREHFKENIDQVAELIFAAKFASQKDSVDPMEKAIDLFYSENSSSDKSKYKLLKEYPLSKDLFAMTRVYESSDDEQIHVFSKGAPEAIFGLCKMSKKEISDNLKIVQEAAEKGFRVIGVANTFLKTKTTPENQQGFDFKFIGFIGFEDPIRVEVPQAVKECHEAGIKVIMITGDYPATARSIADQIGLPQESEILTGAELNELSDAELKTKIRTTQIFARVIPDQKLRIVSALKKNHEIVAMTGDGVNDAPALKAANIGIAMGKKGTDVAREASSIVLLDDNFASIVSAIRSGRRIFDNLQKAMSYILAIHIPIIGLTLIPAFFPGLPLLLMPLHIVFMELIIDPVCSIAFESEKEELGIMKRLPRKPDEKFFGRKKIFHSLLQGGILLMMVSAVYFITFALEYSEGQIRSLTFSALILGNIFLILTNLSKTRSFFAVIKEKNIPLIVILLLAFVMLLLINTIPFLRGIFNFEFPRIQAFLIPVIGAICILIVFETAKWFRNNLRKEKVVRNK